MADHAMLLIFALVIDWLLGDPSQLWNRVPHPVVGFGKVIGVLEKRFNDHGNGDDNDAGESNINDGISMAGRQEKVIKIGALVIAGLIIGSIVSALAILWLISFWGILGRLVEILVVWVFLAQKSLYDHVVAVAEALGQSGLGAARTAVSLIVGRDPETLDEAGICRATIESLAENYCDGIVAPAFWYLLFGLPGLFAYKMINTADSMIAHKSARYLYFGRATAMIDDLANWLPARLSALLICIGAWARYGHKRAFSALAIAMRDAGLHRSPNAGWPETAMAGACEITLGGPRQYGNDIVSQAFINGSGRKSLIAGDICQALGVFSNACYTLWGILLIWYFAI